MMLGSGSYERLRTIYEDRTGARSSDRSRSKLHSARRACLQGRLRNLPHPSPESTKVLQPNPQRVRLPGMHRVRIGQEFRSIIIRESALERNKNTSVSYLPERVRSNCAPAAVIHGSWFSSFWQVSPREMSRAQKLVSSWLTTTPAANYAYRDCLFPVWNLTRSRA